ncbi:uncharacterized protein DFL_000552 [Arthrobotrys flagrans]|uniref:GH16 domain-containing protein n=1 Tax=Arthrobotrys flagrans TaxID=97331 RepID=A0A437AE32_ARTFL|nr:hypothetical protein DFL_000552 [Arthrobotrys flagrans]
MLSLTILTILLGATVTTYAESTNDLTTRDADPNAPPLCRLHAEWVMIADGRKSTFSWPYDQIKMHVSVKDDIKANWSGWPADANLVLTNFNADRDKGEWTSLTENLSPDRFSSTCDASEKGQCWTDIEGRPRLRASPQHAFRDQGWFEEGKKPNGNRFKMRDYVHFYWGPLDDVRQAWHTDDNGKEDDMWVYDIRKNPYCRLGRDDAGKGVSWQYYNDGGLHVYIDDRTDPSWAVAEVFIHPPIFPQIRYARFVKHEG